MFFPGMTSSSWSSSRTSATLPDASELAMAEDRVVYVPTTTPSPRKKKGRYPPPLPFRLPSDDENDDEFSKERPCTSSVNNDQSVMVTYPSKSISPRKSPLKRNSEAKDRETSRVVSRLFAYGGSIPKEYVRKIYRDYFDDHRMPWTKLYNSNDLDKYMRWCRSNVPDVFWSTFQKKEGQQGINSRACFDVVHQAATNTAIKFMAYLDKDKSLELGSEVRLGDRRIEMIPFLCRNLAGLILSFSKQNIKFSVIDEFFEEFFSYGFRAVMHLNDLEEKSKLGESSSAMDTSSNNDVCKGCSENPCICANIKVLFKAANLGLHGLGLMDELAGPRLYSVIQREMKEHVNECVSEKYDIGHLDPLMKWFNQRRKIWIETIYPWMRSIDEDHLKKVGEEFLIMLLDIYGKCIISDMFSIIIEFPESQPILDDLRYCMKEANLRNELVSVLKSALERRLLNAGVNTDNVLEAYVATVRALKFVDPSGILAQLVTPPVREYLKHREETVRVILVSLTDESGELAEELSKNPAYVDKKNINMANWQTWEPDPIDVPKDKFNLRKSDLIQALVSIYGSKTVFIDEYRALLADRLLKMPKPGSITREIKCLELLKLRFGESDLQKCEVMLKDVSDSQRLNVRFYEEEGAVLADCNVKLTGLVVSAQFWPNFKQETLELPNPVEAAMEKYTKAFEMIKGNRTLEWQKQIGTVEIEVEHGGTTLTLTVSPAQATVIWHFQEIEQWKLEDLCRATGTTMSALKSRIAFWISKGILTQVEDDVYELVDSVSENAKPSAVAAKFTEEVEHDSPMTSMSSQRATELQMFWSYIEGMLTNLDSLPLARIHSMLKLFATVECSSEELQKFLDEKVSQNMLVYSAGQYQLPK